MAKITFVSSDANHGYKLWATDGTVAGIVLLRKFQPGPSKFAPGYFTSLGNGKIVFAADDGIHGPELWVTDGTSEGTFLLKDIYPGDIGSFQGITVALGNGRLMFWAADPTHRYEPWVTDGTPAGTFLLKDIMPGNFDSYPEYLTPLGNGKVVFSVDDGPHGIEPWVTDGTPAGTFLLKDIQSEDYIFTHNSFPRAFVALSSGKVVFEAREDAHGNELWVTDGTSAGTVLLRDIKPGPADSSVGSGFFATLGNGKLLFDADDGTHGNELWVTDGTPAGTKLFKDINPGLGGSTPYSFTALGNGKLVGELKDGTHGYEPWVTDGTPAGTFQLKDIYPGFNGSTPEDFTALGNGRMLFKANDDAHGSELWVTDGTAAGTKLFKDIAPGFYGSTPFNLTALGNGKLVFDADDGAHGYEPWVTDGTPAGTVLLRDINPGPTGTFALLSGDFMPLDVGKAVFLADDGSHGIGLWVTDGTSAGTVLLKHIDTDGDALDPGYSFMALGNGTALLSADDGVHGYRLWVTDGTPEGTTFRNDIIGPTDFTAFFPPIIGTAGGDSLSGGAGDDVISGLGGNDTLTGNAGSDWLDGGTGNDVMRGGVGNDTYVVDSVGDVVVELAGQGADIVQSSISYVLAANIEKLTLTGAANLNGVGNALANLLTGNSGNNTLDGKTGADTMKGRAGNDIYYVDNAGDVVTELVNQGTDTVRSTISYTLADNIERLTLAGTGTLNGTGNALANLLTGNTGSNVLDGKAGADTMKGGIGNDIYYVENTSDLVTELANEGMDTVRSTIGYALTDNVENLILAGSANVNATGNGLVNVLTGNVGNNILDGKAGADVMAGAAGNDTYHVDNAGDQVQEAVSQGTDTVVSSVSYSLGGQYAENLTLTGSANLNANGNGLANTLTGNFGNNVLNGNAGADVMTGGGGSDSFVFSTALVAGTIDTITDFSVGDDRIRLSAAVFNTIVGTGTLSAAQFVANASGTAQDANDRIIYETDTGKLLFDSNGSAAGGAVQFATVSPGLALTNARFSVF